MPNLLVKHPLESRRYFFEFGGLTSPQSSRDVIFVAGRLGLNEGYNPSQLLPLLFGSLVATKTTVTFSSTRDDSNPSDLSFGTGVVSGTQASVPIGAGTAGRTYTITAVVGPTNQGNTLVGEGALVLSTLLPGTVQLIKHPSENRLYSVDFGQSSLFGGSRSSTFTVGGGGAGLQTSATPISEGIPANTVSRMLSLPLLLQSMAGPQSNLVIQVTRDDGLPSDLVVGTPTQTGSMIQAQISGGTSGHVYTLTGTVGPTSPQQNVLAGQGLMTVTTALP